MTTINDSPITNDSDAELEAFEQRVNEMLSTGELDSALSITDENGVAQVLPMLDTEPIAHLLDGIEELGGSANVFVRTTINDSPITNDSDTELEAFEQRVNEMLSTGELDSALSITDENGVAQVLPMLDTEPIAHLLDGIEELGGSANVFVRTAEGTASLTVNEYSPEDAALDAAESEADAEADAQSAE